MITLERRLQLLDLGVRLIELILRHRQPLDIRRTRVGALVGRGLVAHGALRLGLRHLRTPLGRLELLAQLPLRAEPLLLERHHLALQLALDRLVEL